MPRLEYKYSFPLEYLDPLRHDMLPFLGYDQHIDLFSKREYTVRSTYLDSSCLSTYYEKLAGIKTRNKYRVRGYNQLLDESLVFLEIKRKDVDHVSKKRSAVKFKDLKKFLDSRDFSLILASGEGNKDISDAREFLFYYCLHNLQPIAVVTYEREAFMCKFGSGLRITFDKNIRTRSTNSFDDLFSDDNMVPTIGNNFVLEIKFDRIIPSWLPIVLNRYNIMREAVSKYALSIDVTLNNNYNLLTKQRLAL